MVVSQNNWAAKGPVKQTINKPKTVAPAKAADGDARHTGVVESYSKWKGCGFIKPHDASVVPGGKLFVFWKAITSDDRYPTLQEGLEVEFGISKWAQTDSWGNKKDMQAKKVSLPGGAPVMIQEQLDAERKEFVGGQELRYSGVLQWYSVAKKQGSVLLDEGFVVPAEMPKELALDEHEVNAGGKKPPKMQKDLAVEFGIYKTKKGRFKVYNMTLPGGDAITQEALEGRHMASAAKFVGVVEVWNSWSNYGFIKPDVPASLPKDVKAKLAAGEKENKGLLYFRRSDVTWSPGFKVYKGVKVAFTAYVDNKGAGALVLAP